MKRYTIEIEGQSDGFNIEFIKDSLEKHLTRKLAAYKIKATAQVRLKAVILLSTDLPSRDLLKLIYEIRSQYPLIRHLRTSLGWEIPVSFEGIIQLKDEEKDPHFYLVKVQPEREMIYAYSRFGWTWLIISYVFLFAFCFSFTQNMVYVNDKMPVLLSLMFISILAYSLFSIILSIKCNELGIEFRYLLRPRTVVLWTQIQSLKIVFRRGEWCIIQRIDGKTAFPYSGAYQGEKMLIKTIIEKANLCFTGLSSDITYSRAELIG